MECEQIRENLSAYVDGEISGEERDRVEGHLVACETCAGALAELNAYLERIGKLEEVDPPPWLTQKVMARVQSESEEKRGFYQRFFPQFLLARPIHALATVLILVLSVYVFQSMKTGVQKPEESKEVAKKVTDDISLPVEKRQAPGETAPDAGRRERDEQEKAPAGAVMERAAPAPGRNLSEAPAQLPPADREKVGADGYAQAPAVTSPASREKQAQEHAGKAAKGEFRPLIMGEPATGKFDVKLIVTVSDLEAARDEIEEILAKTAGTVILKKHFDTKVATFHAATGKEHITALKGRLSKVGKVRQEKGAFEGERAGGEEVVVMIEIYPAGQKP
ncbi:MAG: DUF2275 domain-containing protein [Deltaproteobacteria bacterium]|nr:DUF2275 domain-containing protein [Deltaproteobacteria bacterium]NIS76226.1 DUF2275 domain-containing protein [Deltaproteobacteria bacterium]